MSVDEGPNFILPNKIEGILSVLSGLYAENKKLVLQNIVVNSQFSVDVGFDYDNWNNGSYGHKIHFLLHKELYLQVRDKKSDIETQLCSDINSLASCEDEYVCLVVLDLDVDDAPNDWRKKSGALVNKKIQSLKMSNKKLGGLWEPGFFRVFLSHKDEHKELAKELKESLLNYGVTCFVAHEDIEPTKEWQNEIEKALFSAEALVALLTKDFHKSKWTDQEVGVAFGRDIAIVPVKMGSIPYGFIGKYQALQGRNKKAKIIAEEIFNLFFKDASTKPRVLDALVLRLERSRSFNQSNMIMEFLSKIESAPPEIIKRLENARDSNNQVDGAFDVKRELPLLLKRLKNS